MSNINELINVNTWREYVETNDDSGYFDYLRATEEIVAQLDVLVMKSESFKELKEQIISFNKERKDFVNYAYNHLE